MLIGPNSFESPPVPSSCSFGVTPLVLGDDYRGRSVMKMGGTPVSCRKDGRGEFVTVAEAMETLVARQPGLTATQISQLLFANECESERVDLMCRRLIAKGRLQRCGADTIADPFAYSPKRAKRS